MVFAEGEDQEEKYINKGLPGSWANRQKAVHGRRRHLAYARTGRKKTTNSGSSMHGL
jgi:hypothetical protein